MSRWAPLLLLAAAVLLTACVQHEARMPGTERRVDDAHMLAGMQVGGERHPLVAPVQVSDGLPLDLPVAWWYRRQDGELVRGRARLTTPLPWWQRFPADFVTDIAPLRFTVAVQRPLADRPTPRRDWDVVLENGRAAGYVRDDRGE